MDHNKIHKYNCKNTEFPSNLKCYVTVTNPLHDRKLQATANSHVKTIQCKLQCNLRITVTHHREVNVANIASTCWKVRIGVGLKYSDDNSDGILAAQKQNGRNIRMNQTEKLNTTTMSSDDED